MYVVVRAGERGDEWFVMSDQQAIDRGISEMNKAGEYATRAEAQARADQLNEELGR